MVVLLLRWFCQKEVKVVRIPLWLVKQALAMVASHGEGESLPLWASRTPLSQR
ncbi:MAG: hypothetical protein K0R39_468 [Symbiobacteriaceae bacterium]|jgi:hypothetical protein|nr:hypothetical protein [Symbiobacteriaceae bacterium]